MKSSFCLIQYEDTHPMELIYLRSLHINNIIHTWNRCCHSIFRQLVFVSFLPTFTFLDISVLFSLSRGNSSKLAKSNIGLCNMQLVYGNDFFETESYLAFLTRYCFIMRALFILSFWTWQIIWVYLYLVQKLEIQNMFI